jgi:very-short-patch-repair endonuclease
MPFDMPTDSHYKLHQLPYNPALKARAAAMRKSGNPAEIQFWMAVKNKRLSGLDFDRQRVIGNYIVDFYCHALGLVIEIDGLSHVGKQAYDAVRDDYLSGLGLQIAHFSDRQVACELPRILGWIKALPRPASRKALPRPASRKALPRPAGTPS